MEQRSLKQLSGELILLGSHILDLLKRARLEAERLPDAVQRQDSSQWLEEATENVTRYLHQVEQALARKSPTELEHAATNFGTLPRYVSDYDYSWFSGQTELTRVLTSIRATVVPIATLIDRFNPENLAAARKALE